MLKYALMAIAAAVVVAAVFIVLPIGNGSHPPPRLLTSSDTQPATSFTIHDAAPPTPTPVPAPASPTVVNGTAAPAPGDLDAVMQRLRNAGPAPTTATPDVAAAQPAPASTPTPAPQPTPAPTPPAADPATVAPPPTRWASVTAQGTRWRMARANNGYVVSIDLGGGQVADIHVQPAFANLDPAAVNVRVDYLRDTITQNFSSHAGSYTFARDGSVSIDR